MNMYSSIHPRDEEEYNVSLFNIPSDLPYHPNGNFYALEIECEHGEFTFYIRDLDQLQRLYEDIQACVLKAVMKVEEALDS